MTKVALVYPHIDGIVGYPRDFARLSKELHDLEIDSVHIGYPSAPSNAMVRARYLLRKLKDHLKEVQVVHFVGFFFPEYLRAYRAATAAGVPYVISPLSNLQCFAMQRNLLKKRLFVALGGSTFLRKAKAIHSFGSSETESVLNLGFRGDIFEIPLGVYVEDLQEYAVRAGADAADVTASSGKDYVLFFGRLDVYQKGLDLLLDGFDLYCRKNPNGLNLVIAGRSWEGSHQWLNARISSMSRPTRATLIGETTERAKVDLIRGARAVIYPSRFDGPPRPLRDAIALGVFVLASRQSNVYPDLENHGLGRFIDVNRISISEAIKVVETGTVRLSSDLGRSLLAWERIADRYADMYRSVVGNP